MIATITGSIARMNTNVFFFFNELKLSDFRFILGFLLQPFQLDAAQ